MIQLILHLIGDYITQSHWMAENKTKRSWPALVHAVVYSLPFLLLKPSITAFSVILITHFFIDRFRLARFVVWLKNVILSGDAYKYGWPSARTQKGLKQWPEELQMMGIDCSEEAVEFHNKWKWSNCSSTGYPSEVPSWLSVWLLIVVDNTLHLTINYLALKFL